MERWNYGITFRRISSGIINLMKIEERGTSPYKVMSSGLVDCPPQSANAATFLEALGIIFDLTDGGRDIHKDSLYVITPKQIIDVLGNVVFCAGNEEDVGLLKQIDKVGFDKLELVKPGVK